VLFGAVEKDIETIGSDMVSWPAGPVTVVLNILTIFWLPFVTMALNCSVIPVICKVGNLL